MHFGERERDDNDDGLRERERAGALWKWLIPFKVSTISRL